jgi:hypothetical protein
VRGEFDLGGIKFGSGPLVGQWVAEGGAGPGDVGGDFDHERFDQRQVDWAFVFAESVQRGFADLFGPGMPGPRRAEVAAELAPCSGGEDCGSAYDPQLPVQRQAGDDGLGLGHRTYDGSADNVQDIFVLQLQPGARAVIGLRASLKDQPFHSCRGQVP